MGRGARYILLDAGRLRDVDELPGIDRMGPFRAPDFAHFNRNQVMLLVKKLSSLNRTSERK